jgi:hypothetical protein
MEFIDRLTFSGSRITTFTREIILEDPNDNPYATKSELAALSGATLIGYQRPFDGALMTVSQAIDAATASNSATILGTVLAGLSTATNAAITAADTILGALGKLQKQLTDWMAKKDATGGYAGLTAFAINTKNTGGTVTSTITNAATVARVYTMPDKDITVAGLADIPSTAVSLLSTATVGTAVANIDFLSLFSTTYDKYVIEVQNCIPSVNGGLYLRCAVAGAADSATNYYRANFGASSATAVALFDTMAGVSATTTGISLTIEIRNANDTTNAKVITANGAQLASGSLTNLQSSGVYAGGKVTGIRLYWSSSGNFTAGVVRVYGIKNT